MCRRPPRSPRTDPLFPYTPLFRSLVPRRRHSSSIAIIFSATHCGLRNPFVRHPSDPRSTRAGGSRMGTMAMRNSRPALALLTGIAACAVPTSAYAQEAESYNFDLPAQDLGDALRSDERRVGTEWVSTS